MSEYQYYEFRAVDKPLTPQQQAELRSRSSRATITATSFINEYHWGDLKGDPLDWVQRYFDAHVYSASWGTCSLMLRLPLSALDKDMLDPFTQSSRCGAQSGFRDAFGVTPTADHRIVYWGFNDDSGEFERFWSQEDGPGWMSSLLPLRDELLRGDTRPLYLGWLARVCNEEVGDDDIEPPVPAGLQTLTPAQTALTEFLLIDPDWLAAAAGASPTLPDRDTIDPERDDWLALQTQEAMRETLRLLLEGRSQEAERALRQRYLAWQRERSSHPKSSSRRTVAEIDAACEWVRNQRLEIERRKREAEEAKRHAERKQRLERLAAHSDRVWADIDQTLQRGTGHAYDQALQTMKDLAEAMTQAGREAEFQAGLVKLLGAHGKRGAWMRRLTKEGILKGEI
ncbi:MULTISPECIES: hypothetical protein [Methylomicrobium]|uniref:Uncharacterized protein n=1 Tax=Methylomicrobium album BG8 TaxID=686340 RepID=H8GQV8_METAL|nr:MULTISPECIES: hypothetical protein [Methylomicrobium]EIC28617.1 hypothetical protein Metal_0785 [Methylomicrobium album BG8]